MTGKKALRDGDNEVGQEFYFISNIGRICAEHPREI